MNLDWRGLPPDTARRLEQLGQADLVVGLPGCAESGAVRLAAEAWRTARHRFGTVPRTVIFHADPGTSDEPPEGSAPADGAPTLVYAPMTGAGRLDDLASRYSATVRHVMSVTQFLDARAGCLLGSLSSTITPDEIDRLLRPVLEQGVDLMVPRFEVSRFEALITRGVIGPLARALFGPRLHDPMVVNFAGSAKLAARLAEPGRVGSSRTLIWLASEAACQGMTIGETFVRRPDLSGEPDDLVTVVGTVLGSLFLDMERHAACWQRIHASRPVQTSGTPGEIPGTVPPVDAGLLVDSFRTAFTNLADVWSALLPPATLLDLKKLTRLPAAQFGIPDELWARIVYDIALGSRLRVISRDHVLRSFVPLYLAWVASWITQDRGEAAAEDRQNALCLAFERQKPYLLSRWRWPDRFSP